MFRLKSEVRFPSNNTALLKQPTTNCLHYNTSTCVIELICHHLYRDTKGKIILPVVVIENSFTYSKWRASFVKKWRDVGGRRRRAGSSISARVYPGTGSQPAAKYQYLYGAWPCWLIAGPSSRQMCVIIGPQINYPCFARQLPSFHCPETPTRSFVRGGIRRLRQPPPPSGHFFCFFRGVNSEFILGIQRRTILY